MAILQIFGVASAAMSVLAAENAWVLVGMLAFFAGVVCAAACYIKCSWSRHLAVLAELEKRAREKAGLS